MLEDRHDLDHTEVGKKLVVLFLTLAVLNEIRTEHEDCCSKDRQDLQRFETEYAVPQQVNLVND